MYERIYHTSHTPPLAPAWGMSHTGLSGRSLLHEGSHTPVPPYTSNDKELLTILLTK